MPVEAAEENRVPLSWGLEISSLAENVIELVRVLARQVRQRQTCKPRREIRRQRGIDQRRKTRKFISRMFAPSSTSAVGIWTLITAFSSGSSSNAVGTMLKFAAIGVISVPQNPDNIPIAAIIVGSPPNFWTINGRPIPAVITGNAANAFPMIIVNAAMPIA